MTVLKNVGMVLGILVLLLAGLAATGTLGSLLFASFVYFNGPDHEFDPALAVPAPDYADELNWAALPSKIDEADVLPIGVMPEFEQGSAPVDVLFLHPTGYLSRRKLEFADGDRQCDRGEHALDAGQSSESVQRLL